MRLRLSQIWTRASKELKQVKGEYGDVKKKTACATGAIVYYISKGKTVRPTDLENKQYQEFSRLTTEYHKGDVPYDAGIVGANDEKGWSFKRFAQEARKRGV